MMNGKTHKHNRVTLIVIALAAFYCTLPLFFYRGLPNAADLAFHLFHADQFDRSLHEGVVYPRWVADSNNGYGSPNFIFYSPLSYYFVSFFRMFGLSLTVSMIISVWSGFFLSGLTMSAAAKKLFGETAGPPSAIVYQILPFHLTDLYVRFSFAELFAFAWFPLIFLCMHDTLNSRNKIAFAGLSISYAGLIMTHLVSGFIFTVVVSAFLVYCYFSENKKAVLKALLSLVVGLGLSSIYLIPVFFERKFVHISFIVKNAFGDYRKNFFFMWDKIQERLRAFYLPLHIGLILEVLLFLFIILLIRDRRRNLSAGNEENFFIFFFIFAFFLTTPLSEFLWSVIPGFSELQFPWRWMGVMEFMLCFLIGAVFSSGDTPGLQPPSRYKKAVVCLVIVLLGSSFIRVFGSDILPAASVEKALVETVTRDKAPTIEYAPIWANEMEKTLKEQNERVSVISGTATIQVAGWRPERRTININASTPTVLKIFTFYYPGWAAELDGSRKQIAIEKGTGAMMIDVPAGYHSLEMKFGETTLRYRAKIISLFSIVALVSCTLFLR